MFITLLNNTLYYIIQRQNSNDYLVHPYYPWTSSETAFISFCLALYLIGFVVASMEFIESLVRKRLYKIRLLILFIVVSFFIFRAVLFIIALASPVSLRSPTVGYVLIEFPLILYFDFITFFIPNWTNVIRVSANIKGENDFWMKLSWGLAIAITVLVIGIFIIVVILFQTIVAPGYYACRGAVFISDDPTAFVIVVVYRSIFSAAALLLGILLLYVGYRVLAVLQSLSRISLFVKIRIATAIVVGSIGLFIQAVYYLTIIASKTEQQQSIKLSLSILLIDEIIPSLAFLACLVSWSTWGKKLENIRTGLSGSGNSGNPKENLSPDETTETQSPRSS